MTRKLIALVATLIAVAVGAVAVSGCGAEKAAGVDVASAATTTAAKKTAKVDMTVRLTGSALPAGMTLKASGVTDLTKPRGNFTFDLASIAQSAGVPATMLGSDPSLQVIFDGGQLYAKIPDIALLTSRLGGKRWISADIAQLAPGLGIDPKSYGDLFTVDPASQMKTITGLKSMKSAGKETLDGAQVTRFTGSYTAKDIIAALPAAKRAAVKRATDKLAALPGGTNALDTPQKATLWVDGDGVMRKMQVSATLPQNLGRYEIDYHLTDFGTPLDVTAPAASDTYVVTPAAVKKLMSSGITP